jgi:hypothetical protein
VKISYKIALNLLKLAGICGVGMTLLVGGAFAQQNSLKDQIAGSWVVQSAADKYQDGHSGDPWGKNMKGMITFDKAGNFSEILIGQADPKMKTSDPRKPDALAVSYFGTYEVSGNNSISMKIKGASFSARENSDQTLTVSGTGDTLTLVGSKRTDQHGEFSPTFQVKRAQ